MKNFEPVPGCSIIDSDFRNFGVASIHLEQLHLMRNLHILPSELTITVWAIRLVPWENLLQKKYGKDNLAYSATNDKENVHHSIQPLPPQPWIRGRPAHTTEWGWGHLWLFEVAASTDAGLHPACAAALACLPRRRSPACLPTLVPRRTR
jgi:hypothetical protein